MAEWNQLNAKKEACRRVNSRRQNFTSLDVFHQRQKEEAQSAKYITQLVKWCDEHKYKVIFDPKYNDEIYQTRRLIKICSKPSLQSQLIGLIHECGHVILDESRDYWIKYERGWPKVRTKDKRLKKSAIHRIQLLEEEIEAWNKAEILAKELRIKINVKMFHQIKYYCLMHYVKFSARLSNMPY